MQAFEFWTEFYTNYSFELTITWATFINRFRTGEMPIGISDYNVYNTLMVSAPEIRGKWTFANMPGTRQEDGTIDRSTATSGTAVIMLKTTNVPEAAWEFMKWWTDADTQTAYNRELESIIGTAARHATPNIEAFSRLPWTVEELEILNAQFPWTVGVPEVPGGYYTGRNLENAFRKVVNNNINPRQTFEEYIVMINHEITRKREEFGLPVPTGE
jgi:ABC-type glycerol-3-phosphate transport system substrate-binding protein